MPFGETALGDEPAISVIVPMYNVNETIVRCVKSLLSQENSPAFEVLLIDDESQDGTPDRVRERFDADARVRLILQHHAGVSVARNRGLDVARGAFVAFVDADDVVEPYYLSRLATALTDDVDLVVTEAVDVDERGHALGRMAVRRCARTFRFDDSYNPMGALGHATVWGCLIRRTIIGSIRFDSAYEVAEDVVFYYQVLARSRAAVYVPSCGYRYIRRFGSLKSARSAESWLGEVDAWQVVARLAPEGSRLERRLLGAAAWMAAAGVRALDVRCSPKQSLGCLKFLRHHFWSGLALAVACWRPDQIVRLVVSAAFGTRIAPLCRLWPHISHHKKSYTSPDEGK